MRALAFEHLRPNPIGVYGDVLDGRGIGVDRVLVDVDGAVPDWRAYDFLVVMGAAADVWDRDGHPWLAAEEETVREAVLAGVPYFGVCFGAQLLASAFGAHSYRGMEAELGINHVWMHWGVGGTSVSDAATDHGRRHGITVIDGGCPLMFGPTADFRLISEPAPTWMPRISDSGTPSTIEPTMPIAPPVPPLPDRRSTTLSPRRKTPTPTSIQRANCQRSRTSASGTRSKGMAAIIAPGSEAAEDADQPGRDEHPADEQTGEE